MSEIREDSRKRLVSALKSPPQYMEDRLKRLKREGIERRKRPDLLWYQLVSSAATQGNAKGWVRLSRKADWLRSIAFSALLPLSVSKRKDAIRRTFKEANVRMQSRKDEWLAKNLEKIMKDWGGLKQANAHMRSLHGKVEKLKFIGEFHGVGPKYQRNIWMDLYDPDFLDAIAIDSRLAEVARALGCEKPTQSNGEPLFCSVAEDANRKPWDVDRLLFNFNEHFLWTIQGEPASRPVPFIA
jgi:hypothetical protein